MAISSEGHPDTLSVRSSRGAWSVAGTSLVATAVVLCCIFSTEAQGAFRVWLGSTADNHCFLVLPVAAYLAWTRRGSLQGLTPRPDLRALVLLVPLSLLWMITALVSVLELQQLVVMTMFQVIAFSVLGWMAYRAMLMPFLYLFFLVPTGYFLVPSLQNFTAWFAVAALKLVGVPVYWDGTFIEVPAGDFVVAEACAGLRFLIASVAFGVFFATLVYRSRVRWLLFVALSFVVPIIANGMRAFGIIMLAEATGNAAAIEADHIIYGWGFFTAVTLLLIVIGLRFSDEREPGPGPVRSIVRASGASRPWASIVAAVLGIGLAASGPAYAQIRYWHTDDAALLNTTVLPPARPWTLAPPDLFGWTPKINDPDREITADYTNGHDDLLYYVALYKAGGLRNNLVRGMNEIADGKIWTLLNNGSITTDVGGKEATIATTDIASGARRLMVWHFYVVGGRIAASPFKAKLLQLATMFSNTDRVDAFVAVAADENAETKRPENALREFLAAMRLQGQ